MKNTRKMTNTIFAMFLGLLVIAASNQAFAQGGTWETKSPMPTARGGAAGGVINGKLYVVGGQNTQGQKLATLEVYDPATDTWTTKAPMPTARGHVGGGVINGKLYVVGGQNTQGQKLATLEVYDPVTDTWATKAPILTPRNLTEAVAIDGKLYVVGGCMGWCAPTTSALEVYDPVTDTWTTKAPMPTERAGSAVAVVDGLFYVMGGGWGWTAAESDLMVKAIEVYNPTTNTWSTKTQHFVGLGGTAGSINGKIYVAGESYYTISAASEVYDPATDTWASLLPMSTARYLATGGVINGKLYVAGGDDGTGVVVAALEAFTPGSACEPKAITLDTKKLNLKLGEGKTVTVTVSGSDDCESEGATVTAVIKTGKDRVTINPANDQTDENGQATFTITAGQKKGNAKVVFTVEDSEGEVYTTFVIVKIKKKKKQV